MIPKLIHYVWVGDSEKSELAKKCIESWSRFLPDYQIIEWGNESLANIDNQYLQEAYLCKKWAFVSDYLRLHALLQHGGFYFDTDLEITKSVDDFRSHTFVIGFELHDGNFSPMSALIGAKKGNAMIQGLLSEYENISFINNGSMNLETNTVKIGRFFSKNYGLSKPYNGCEVFELSPGSKIYPYSHFCTRVVGFENYSIHHFNGSWMEDYVRKTLLQVMGFRVVALKKIYNSGRAMPLFPDEKMALKLLNLSKYSIAIFRVTNNE
ncbi:MAG: glycosyltransferase [Proteobacteria bacterium]|nr:glycosyltransferase [Pseudomonadota bacterium]